MMYHGAQLVLLVCILRTPGCGAQEVERDWMSCKDRCPEGYIPGLPCYCNQACFTYENCCDDYYAQCKPDQPEGDDWMTYGKREYRYYADATSTATSAATSCRSEGALLVSVSTRGQHQFLASRVLRLRALTVFIGARATTESSSWTWSDGSRVPLPSDAWSEWYPGEPDRKLESSDACAVLTNFRFWTTRKVTFDSYFWVDFACDANSQVVQGYICERSTACDPNPCQNEGTCAFIGGLLETECRCAVGYVGAVCQGQAGEPWYACGERILEGSTGEVTSPQYPRPYPNLAQCNWTISVSPGNSITLRIESLALEAGKGCVFDALDVYDGTSNKGSKLIGSVCNANEVIIGQPLVSTTNSVYITFTSDASVQERGFKLTYKENTCGRGSGDSGCGTARRLVDDCGQIEVQKGPQGVTTSDCRWDIAVGQGKKVNLTFTDFNIPDPDISCSTASLAVYDGSTEDTGLIQRYCGRTFPWFIISSGRYLTIVLSGVSWDEGHVINMAYQTIDAGEWRVLNPVEEMESTSGGFSSSSSQPQTETTTGVIQKWRVRAPVGMIVSLQWSVRSTGKSAVKIYDGCCEESTTVTNLELELSRSPTERQGEVTSSAFQLLVYVMRSHDDDDFRFDAVYISKDWNPVLSGCYRPLYSSATTIPSTENSIVTSQRPVFIMAARESHQFSKPGYDEGLYCTWTIQTDGKSLMAVELLDVNIIRHGTSCDADGVVIYGGSTSDKKKYGPFCGSSVDQLKNLIEPGTSQIRVVFYSDSRGGRRANGTFRASVQTAGKSRCRRDEMMKPETVQMTSPCGVMTSPRLPGDVQPGRWTWIIAPPTDKYFIVSVAYVRGPGLIGDCNAYFRLLEIARGSGLRRHWEAELLKVCQNEQLRVPDDPIKVPLNQKLGIELSTEASQFAQRWEFKLSYTSHSLTAPKDIQLASARCPVEYVYFGDSCYRYYTWYWRQTAPVDFRFLETWQAARERCQVEGGFLVSITDEQEARFIKYAFSVNDTLKLWSWDDVGTWQTNHRMVFIGLNNRYGRYVWDSGVSMAYADWYRPPRKGLQPAVHSDTPAGDLFDLASSQPSADLGSLCTVMLVTSPFGSLNWAKVPCDYPLSKAGAICEQPAKPATSASIMSNKDDSIRIPVSYKGCAKGWVAVGSTDTDGRCLRMFTSYDRVKRSNLLTPGTSEQLTSTSVPDLSEAESRVRCQQLGGTMANMGRHGKVPEEVMDLLVLWRHTDLTGNVRVESAPNGGECQIIQVSLNEESVRLLDYTVATVPCDTTDQYGIYSVLCQKDLSDLRHTCTGSNRYTCADGSCIDIDFRCDGDMDCADNSDESNCTMGLDTFICDNGRMISLSLVCDFTDNCRDNSDEKHCVLERCAENSFQCSNGECIQMTLACDFRPDCKDESDEEPELCESRCTGFQCFSGRCIQSQLVHDMVSDCPGLSQEDETIYDRDVETLQSNTGRSVEAKVLNETFVVGCEKSGEHAQCRFNHANCFRRADVCRYDRKLADPGRASEVQTACRDGAHLRDLCSAIPCPGLFQCPGSYCLPVHRVCDGVPDCPRGEDEPDSCSNKSCPGLLQCKGGKQCVSNDRICDGEIQCPLYRDDERFCQLTDPLCLVRGCRCDGNILRCATANLTSLPTAPGSSSSTARRLRAILLASNKLTEISADIFQGLHWTILVDLSRNRISLIADNAFRDMHNLRQLYLQGNLLHKLTPAMLQGLMSLRKLDLTENLVSVLRRDTLAGLPALEHLRLEGNPLEDVTRDSFVELTNLRQINTDSFKFCCIAKQVDVCTPDPDEFSSCEDLMSNYTLQISIWVLGMFAFVGNLFVVIWRVLTERSRPSSFFIINLGVADFMMGLYLLIIACVDVFYRGQYIVYAERWRKSWLCQLAGILSMLSSEASIFMLCTITGERLYSIMWPLRAPNFRMKHARLVVLTGWCACAFISILPSLPISYFGDAFFGRTGVCLPFHLSEERLPGWEYSVTIFLVANFIAFMFVFAGYVMIFSTVRSSMKAMGASKSAAMDEYSLAKKLALIVATDFLCWVPIILIGFAALGGARISPEVAAWVAVFVLPLNSAVNPVLYTLSNLQCGKNKKRNPSAASGHTMSTTAPSRGATGGGGTNNAYTTNGNDRSAL